MANAEFNTYLRQAQSMLGQFGGISMPNVTSDNPEAIINSSINCIFDILEKIGTQEAAAAKAEGTKNQKNAENIVKKQEEVKSRLDKKISELNERIENNIAIAEEQINILTEQGQNLTKQQEELAKIQKKIEEKQAELESATSAKEKREILREIKGLSEEITVILTSIEDIQKSMEESQAEVEKTESDTAEGQVESEAVQTEGQAEFQALGQQAAQAVTTETAVNTKAITNEATAAAAEAAAAAAESTSAFTFGAGATAAMKFQQIASDQGSAATTRFADSLSHLQTIGIGAQGINNGLSILTTFGNSIGGQFSDISNIIGTYGTMLDPMLVAIGSFEGVATTAGDLATAVDSDIEALGEKDEESKEDENGEQELHTSNIDTRELVIEEAVA